MQAFRMVFHKVRWCRSTGTSQDQTPWWGLDFQVLKSITIVIKLANRVVCGRIYNCIDGFLWYYMVIWCSELELLSFKHVIYGAGFFAVSQRWVLPVLRMHWMYLLIALKIHVGFSSELPKTVEHCIV